MSKKKVCGVMLALFCSRSNRAWFSWMPSLLAEAKGVSASPAKPEYIAVQY
jgi:hypothetical protein